MEELSAEGLRAAIIDALTKQGYQVVGETIRMVENPTKDDYRALNDVARRKKLEDAGPALRPHEDRLIRHIANGDEVKPEQISPRLVVVAPRSENELIFRYACLHWSIPVSAGYGRRLRFLVFDEHNDKLIGLFGLGDPVYSIKARDSWIGWDSESKASRLYHVMDAYVLGAVPPYSHLLGGKLVAMLACSNEVRRAFALKYTGRQSLISQESRPGHLALVTTTSAFGRSSLYNRLRVDGWDYWTSVGFTQGSGEFHFSNGVYDSMREYVEQHCQPTAKHRAWGRGYRNRREVVKKCLLSIGLSADLIYHGIRRQVYVARLAHNSLPFLRGEQDCPQFFDWPAARLFEVFSERWLTGRARRAPEFGRYSREEYRLW